MVTHGNGVQCSFPIADTTSARTSLDDPGFVRPAVDRDAANREIMQLIEQYRLLPYCELLALAGEAGIESQNAAHGELITLSVDVRLSSENSVRINVSAFGSKDWLGSPNAWQWGDFNADGIVDSGDLNEIAQNWQLSIPVAASRKSVPERNALTLLLGVIATLL